ncbi:hypothetical protein BGZ80_007808, partial [Entomortierella chlamydospora]
MSTSERCQDFIHNRRKGANYFLLQPKNPCYKPADYIKFRALKQDQSFTLIDEWTRWILELKKNSYKAVRMAAAAAPPLTQDDIDEYYRHRVYVEREQDALESSKNQLQMADKQHTFHMENRSSGRTWLRIDGDAMTQELDKALN